MNLSAINAAALNGSAEQIWNGSGNVVIAMVMAGQGFGAVIAHGVAIIQTNAAGNAKNAAKGDANSNISIASTGDGSHTNVALAHGDAEIKLNMSGNSTTVVMSHADAVITFGGTYDIRGIRPAPAPYSDAPYARRIGTDADNRVVQVPEDNTLLVRPSQRTQNIQHKGRAA